MTLLRCRDIEVWYGDRRVVERVSLTAGPGRIVAVIGPNGSGKTSLLLAIAGVVGCRGAVYIDGEELSRLPRRLAASLIAYSSDVTVPDYMDLRVYEAVLIARHNVSQGFMDTPEDYEAAREALRSVEALHLWGRRLSTLSSGELRRVVLAMALARRPKVLLLDEPDSYLDARGRVSVSRLIRGLGERHAVVIATHDLVFAVNTADYYIALSNGRVVAEGGRGEVFRPDVLSRVYGVGFHVAVVDGALIPVPRYG